MIDLIFMDAQEKSSNFEEFLFIYCYVKKLENYFDYAVSTASWLPCLKIYGEHLIKDVELLQERLCSFMKAK